MLIIFAGTRGYLDDVPRPKVAEWEQDFLTFVRDQHPAIRSKILETKDLDDATMADLVKAIGEFKAQFAGKESGGQGTKKRRNEKRRIEEEVPKIKGH